jgi:hypothetical protein
VGGGETGTGFERGVAETTGDWGKGGVTGAAGLPIASPVGDDERGRLAVVRRGEVSSTGRARGSREWPSSTGVLRGRFAAASRG